MGRPPRLLDMERHGIDEVNVIPTLGEPDRISPRTATDVRNDGRRRGEIPLEQTPRAGELERAWTMRESVALETLGVVGRDLVGVVRRIAHGSTSSVSTPRWVTPSESTRLGAASFRPHLP
jgi:hypothetical protein